MASNEMRHSFDPETQYAALGERVEGQGRRLTNLETAVSTGFRNVEGSIAALSNELRGSQRTQWPVIWSAIGVCFLVLSGLGAAIYLPQREDIAEAKLSIRENSNQALSVAAFQDFKATYENNRLVSRTEYLDKFGQINERIKTIDAQIVPRQEHERVWASYDQRDADLQRQIDELKTQAGSVYNQRDLLRDVLERLDRLEVRRSRISSE